MRSRVYRRSRHRIGPENGIGLEGLFGHRAVFEWPAQVIRGDRQSEDRMWVSRLRSLLQRKNAISPGSDLDDLSTGWLRPSLASRRPYRSASIHRTGHKL